MTVASCLEGRRVAVGEFVSPDPVSELVMDGMCCSGKRPHQRHAVPFVPYAVRPFRLFLMQYATVPLPRA
jgi:hypothetical protein